MIQRRNMVISDRKWMLILFTAWFLFLSFETVERLEPASNWFTVQDVFVFDTEPFTPPRMEVQRFIKKNFLGTYIAKVERQENGNGFSALCTGTSSTNYTVDAEFPADMDLNWWTFPAKCAQKLKPGKYRVTTRWIIRPSGRATRDVVAESNVFTVAAK